MDGIKVTPKNLRAAKAQWIDKLRYKKVKLDKYIETGNRKKDNIMFQKDQQSVFVHWREWRNTKARCLKWKSLLSSGPAFGSKMK